MLAFNPAHYTFSYYAIPNLVVECLIIGLGILTLKRERYSAVSITFCLFTLSMGEWNFCEAIAHLANNSDTALLWIRLLYAAVDIIGVSIYLFSLTVVQQYRRYR